MNGYNKMELSDNLQIVKTENATKPKKLVDIAKEMEDILNVRNLLTDIIKKKNLSDMIISGEFVKKIESSKQISLKLKNLKINKKNEIKLKKLQTLFGKLEILILMKKLSKLTNGYDIINEFINLINNKLIDVNTILQHKTQTGGTSNYYYKYIKYKIKYIKLNKICKI